jgi:hypothetical protein
MTSMNGITLTWRDAEQLLPRIDRRYPELG